MTRPFAFGGGQQRVWGDRCVLAPRRRGRLACSPHRRRGSRLGPGAFPLGVGGTDTEAAAPSCPWEGAAEGAGRAAGSGCSRGRGGRIPGLASQGKNQSAAGAAGLGAGRGECVCSRGTQKLSSCSTDPAGLTYWTQ